jgi:hypothetical protein
MATSRAGANGAPAKRITDVNTKEPRAPREVRAYRRGAEDSARTSPDRTNASSYAPSTRHTMKTKSAEDSYASLMGLTGGDEGTYNRRGSRRDDAKCRPAADRRDDARGETRRRR